MEFGLCDHPISHSCRCWGEAAAEVRCKLRGCHEERNESHCPYTVPIGERGALSEFVGYPVVGLR